MEKNEILSRTPKWVFFFFVTLLVSCIGAIRSGNYPEYKDSNQALTYIYGHVSSIELELDSATSSYLFVSSIEDTARNVYLVQIYEFKNFRGVTDVIFEGMWNEKEQKVIWCEVTPSQEELIIFVFEKIKNPKEQLIDIIVELFEKIKNSSPPKDWNFFNL